MLRSRLVAQLQTLIDQCGGLHDQASLARRWSVSAAAVSKAVIRPDFPQPVTLIGGKREVWAGIEADAWRATTRKPGPTPRAP